MLALLGGGRHARPLGEELRAELHDCINSILQITGESRLLENDPVVRRAVEARLPFCDTLNILQGTGTTRYDGCRASVETESARVGAVGWAACGATVLVLQRLRASGAGTAPGDAATDAMLHDIMTVTVQGIVAAMGNSG